MSWRGRFAVLFLLFGGAAGVFLGIHPFLAVTKKTAADVLVVEGWVAPGGVREAVREFGSGQYALVITTGGPVDKGGFYSSKYETHAHLAFLRLQSAGVPTEVLREVPARKHDRDRTYSSALALRHWFESNEIPLPAKVNVLTDGAHARRTRLLFRKALGGDVQIGVIAALPSDYSAARWWQYSPGIKDVVSETAAYLYARFLFRPNPGLAAADFAAPDL